MGNRAVIRKLAEKYQRASKTEKGRILDTLVSLSGYSRDHAARVLRTSPKANRPKKKRHRKRVYDAEVLFALRRVWATLDGACGKRLVAAVRR